MRRPSEKPSAAEISAHEEEVAAMLVKYFDQGDEWATIKRLKVSDRLALALGRTYVCMNENLREDPPGSEGFDATVAGIGWLLAATIRQLAIENGSATE